MSDADVRTGDEIGSIEGLKAVATIFASGTGRFVSENHELRQPALDAVDVHGYVAILDATIDKMLAGRHDAPDSNADGNEER